MTFRDGRWKAALPSTPAGGPHKIIVKGADKEIAIDGVMFGEVWIASLPASPFRTDKGK